jgi:hypothetical protein
MRRFQRLALIGALALAVAAAVAAPGQARVDAAPGPWCGGTLWKLMTLSDTGRNSVQWAPSMTTIPAIAKITPPTRITAARTTQFQKQVWESTVILQRYRLASNGEIVLQLFDIPSAMYMNAYMPNPQCLSKTTRGRASILAARDAFTKICPAPTTAWQLLGATVELAGVGFWNPVKTTPGALPNGAELRPVTGFTMKEGCGVFG